MESIFRREPDPDRLSVICIDEKIIANTMALILNMHGFRASGVNDRTEALELAGLCAPDIVIIDTMPWAHPGEPYMSAVDVAVRFREIAPQCRFVFLTITEGGMARVLEEAPQKIGECIVLYKPIRPTALIEELRRRGALTRPGR